jgi:hypothetical protein
MGKAGICEEMNRQNATVACNMQLRRCSGPTISEVQISKSIL